MYFLPVSSELSHTLISFDSHSRPGKISHLKIHPRQPRPSGRVHGCRPRPRPPLSFPCKVDREGEGEARGWEGAWVSPSPLSPLGDNGAPPCPGLLKWPNQKEENRALRPFGGKICPSPPTWAGLVTRWKCPTCLGLSEAPGKREGAQPHGRVTVWSPRSPLGRVSRQQPHRPKGVSGRLRSSIGVGVKGVQCLQTLGAWPLHLPEHRERRASQSTGRGEPRHPEHPVCLARLSLTLMPAPDGRWRPCLAHEETGWRGELHFKVSASKQSWY